MKSTNKLKAIFGRTPGLRCSHKRLYDLESILLVGMISVVCGANSWNEMGNCARAKEDFLRAFLELPNGIPSHDTFNRVSSNIDSNHFERCFMEWVSNLVELQPKEVMAIGGKTIRGAKSGGGNHLSIWSVLGLVGIIWFWDRPK